MPCLRIVHTYDLPDMAFCIIVIYAMDDSIDTQIDKTAAYLVSAIKK